VTDGLVQVAGGIPGRLTAGAHVCLTEHDWLVADQDSQVTATSTAELLADGRLWSRLLAHLTSLLIALDWRVEHQRQAERAALAREAGDRDAARHAAATGFAAVVRDTPLRLAGAAADPAPLAAVRLVAAQLGVTVRAPASGADRGRRLGAVQRVAQASGLRTRNVRLEGRWWRRDLGPMVGYQLVDAAQRPVALLRHRGRYVLALPEQTRTVPVTAAVAATLVTDAVVLYRPVPDGVRGVAGLLRLAALGGRRDVVTIAATGVLVAALGLLVPVLTGAVLGTFAVQGRRDLVVQGALLVIVGALVAAGLSVVQNLAALRLEGRAAAGLQAAVWARLLALPASFFTRFSTGQLGTAALGVAAAQEVVSTVLTVATLGLLAGLANLVLAFVYSLRLALVALGLVLVCALGCGAAAVVEVRWQRRIAGQEQKLASRVYQLLGGIAKLRVAAAEERAYAVWAGEFAAGRGLAASARRVQDLVTTFNAAYPLACALVIFTVVGGPLRGSVSLAGFVAFYTAFTLLVGAVVQFTGVMITATNILPMLEKLEPILRAEPEDPTRADPGELTGRVALDRVSFRYGEEGPLVLDDVSISVEPGEFVAIVGATGSGKSTILRLLLGFETPTGGSVRYDGQDLADLDLVAVRRQCGVVLQHGSLLGGDIQANIIGGTSHTIDDAWAAATMAGIATDIAAMPMGMRTVLSGAGTTLSGGQRQRLMIARALIARPRLVFFDEATSALDNPAQQVVAASTQALRATRLVIAHRLSTVTGADRILVLAGGRIVQQGSYPELLADPAGPFARMAATQLAD
jgi:NHLM bacteriocin system ABC transporter ATP-binding protein